MRFLTRVDLSPGTHAAALAKVRAAVERDDFASADIKKLRGADYHRAKLDYENRLLLRFVRHRGDTVCLALEIIENHAYARSRFLRGSSASDGVDAAVDATAAPVDATATDLATSSVHYVHPERAEFHVLDKPLSFDDAQDAIYRLRPPMLLVGAAGSGKTALALAKMRDVEGTIAYVTQSAFLAQRSRSIYFGEGFADERQSVEFLSFRELVESIRVPAGRAVTFRDFRAWFERHRREIRFGDAHQCFEEIRGVLTSQPEGVLSREAYLELGVRQSIFAPTDRDALYGVFERYRAFLAEARLFDTNLVAHGHLGLAEPRYDFIVVDEVQDLTNVELSLVLRTLKERGAFVLSGDANQIVHPNFFSWSALKSLFWRDTSIAGGERVAVLDVNYRNARRVTKLANALLKVKHARFGSIDKESNGLVRPAAGEDGEIVGLPARDAVVADLDQKTRRSADVAVLVLRDEQKEAARKRFGTPLVFAVHEAKGLEYETVVLYDFVSSERAAYAEIVDGVGQGDLEVEELAFRRPRDKGDKSLEIYKFFVNAMYVAITRAVQRVYVVESDTTHPMLRLLGVEFAADARSVAATKSSVEVWQHEARKLELQGKTEQARAIRDTILRTTPVPWTVLDASGYRALADKALAPSSPSHKAKQSLLDYACFHADRPLAERLGKEAGFAQAARYDDLRPVVLAKMLAPFAAKNLKDVLWQTERHGVDFRTMMNATPLMLAARAGNVELVRALVDRGARLDALDHFGKTAMHWAVQQAIESPEYAKRALAPIWELVAPSGLDVEVDGRLHKIGRELGEYFLFALMTVQHKRRRRSRLWKPPGLTSKDFLEGVDHLPESVLPGFRKRRVYVNGLLARNERGSAAVPNRKLLVRVEHGHYLPNPELRLRVCDDEGVERWVLINHVLGTDLLDEHMVRPPSENEPRKSAADQVVRGITHPRAVLR